MTARRLVVAVVVLGAVAALVPLSGGFAETRARQAARLSDFPTFLFGTVAVNQLRGSIAVIQRSRAPSADAFVSLHGLPPATTFRVAVTDLACSRAATTADAILNIADAGRTTAQNDDFFAKKTGRLSERLARGKSIRVYNGATQIACVAANRVR
jgi:hypothetical protein